MNNQVNRYPCKCPVCGQEFQAAKSIMQKDFGEDDKGCGNCPKCKTFLNLTFLPDENRMVTMVWDDYLKR